MPDGSVVCLGSECADYARGLRYQPAPDAASDPIEKDVEELIESETEESNDPEAEESEEESEESEEVEEDPEESEETEEESEETEEDSEPDEVEEELDIEEPLYTSKYKYYADELPNAADPLSIDNFDKTYQICEVIFNNIDLRGVGATGNNAEIRYMGFGVMMTPEIFLKLASTLEHPTPGSLNNLENKRLNPGWGTPMLYIDAEKGIVTGHEGRHRAIVFAKLCPNRKFLVHIKPHGKYEMRARDVTKEIINKINRGMFSQNITLEKMFRKGQSDEEWTKECYVKGPLFSDVYLDKKPSFT